MQSCPRGKLFSKSSHQGSALSSHALPSLDGVPRLNQMAPHNTREHNRYALKLTLQWPWLWAYTIQNVYKCILVSDSEYVTPSYQHVHFWLCTAINQNRLILWKILRRALNICSRTLLHHVKIDGNWLDSVVWLCRVSKQYGVNITQDDIHTNTLHTIFGFVRGTSGLTQT